MDGLPSDHLRHFPSDFSIAMLVETAPKRFRPLGSEVFFRLENFSIHSP